MKFMKTGFPTSKNPNALTRLLISLAIVMLSAYILSSFFYRIDLTTEKRYTLSPFTVKALRNLDDIVFVKVYLDGDLNIPFQKMQRRIRETLDEFRIHAGDNLEYEFVNPFAGKDALVMDEVVNELYEKGLRPSNILARDKEGGTSEKLVFPGALITYKGTEIPVNLLKNNPRSGADENINNSIQSLEFEFTRIVSSLTADSTEKIAFIEGHGELNEYETGDITRELGWYFQVDRGKISGKPGVLDPYKAIIIAGPTRPFSERDKFVIDQYVMQGGKVLWFIDMVNASLDSLREGGTTVALINEPGIEDLLFRYGVRLNPILIQDIQCNMIPVNVALAGNAADFRPAPWLYSPLLTPPEGHPVTRNLNLIKTEFTGSIDTLGARKEIKKTVLLKSSEFSRIVRAPVMISLEEVRLTPRQEDFGDSYQPVAVLLEGKFQSAYQNRMVSDLFPDTSVQVKYSGMLSSMLVVADRDIIRNEVRPTPQGVMVSPLGFDRYTNQTFGNREFIENVLHYITGHSGLIELRSRELTLRLLDKAKIKKERLKWVLINTVVPPMLVILTGLLFTWFRKRRFAKM
jgi:gliding-associated putative ABC transporter substrate-binding component GldG